MRALPCWLSLLIPMWLHCTPADESAAATNKLCTSDQACPSELACGKGQSDRAQCVKRCYEVGPGPDSGCPTGTFCYIPPDAPKEGHCTLICATAKECQDRHPSLTCKEQAQTEEWALQICILP